MKEFGVCLESIWPYEEGQLHTKPHDEAFIVAERCVITEALSIQPNLKEMKICLAQGHPFVFGLNLFPSFNNAESKGVVPMPRSNEARREEHGRFDILCIVNKKR